MSLPIPITNNHKLNLNQNFTLKEFNTIDDVCDTTLWWKIFLRFDLDRIEITLSQQANPQNQTLTAIVPQLWSLSKSWLVEKSAQNWTLKFLGGETI